MTDFIPGQKWISSAEPELGMGRILRVEHRLVHCYFELAAEERTYAKDQAPLTRARFGEGDEIRTTGGIVITIERVAEKDGILIYHGNYNGSQTAVMETELDPNVRFSKPEERLFTHQLDANRWFNLRYQTLVQRARMAGADSRGLYGPRVSLIPHQLYIASEVAQRFAPRVLLADEVGLGKTIEAGLIMHQQLLTGRAERVLVIVPPALKFQWFVEMIRRFNLQFTMMDEERASQIIADNLPEFEEEQDELLLDNPFEAQQLVLCSIDLFLDNLERLEEAMSAEWDLIVVDEAHHLAWSEEEASPEYQVIDALAQVTRGLLLLTATPEQLGREGHFARLRLLDPDRFHSLEAYSTEEGQYEQVAQAARHLIDGSEQEQATARQEITRLLGENNGSNDHELISALLDRHGTGRVFFRNVRSSVAGFPERLVEPASLASVPAYAAGRFFPETEHTNWLDFDPRVNWLTDLLESSEAKFLIICAHGETAVALEQYLRISTIIRVSAFHEGMDLIARDRAANYFAETERGAQALICSEIGSEGRNFQFAHQLVLFDLPLGPDLLEQRIGRLDRIGQSSDVTIHVPLLEGHISADLFRWYDEGMDLFSGPNAAAQAIFDDFLPRLGKEPLEDLIADTRTLNLARRQQLQQGRDRLIEINSHDTKKSAELVASIAASNNDPELEAYMEQSFTAFGLESEPLPDQVFNVKPTESMMRNTSVSLETMDHFHYPELPEEGVRYTYNRDTALSREDVALFTWENPIVQQAMDVVLTDVLGNSSVIAIKRSNLAAGTLLLETLFIADCQAPAELMADQYLPPQVIRCLITPTMNDIAANVPYDPFADDLNIPATTRYKILDSQAAGIRQMLKVAVESADKNLNTVQGEAMAKMRRSLNYEVERMERLKLVNPNVRNDEVEHLKLTRAALERAISTASLRLDGIRVIVTA